MIAQLVDFLSSKTVVLKFASVGVLATLTHSAVYLVSVSAFGTSPQIANIFGFLVAVTVSYIGQRKWTFGEKTVSSELKTSMKFMVSSATSLSLNAVWVHATTQWLNQPAEYSVIGIMFLTPVIVFLLLKYWVFT